MTIQCAPRLSQNSPFFKNWVRDGVAASIGLIALKMARHPFFAIEGLSLKGVALAGGSFCLGAGLGRVVIGPCDSSELPASDLSSVGLINEWGRALLLASVASLPIGGFYLVGQLSIARSFPKISLRQALTLTTFGGGAILIARPFRWTGTQPVKTSLTPLAESCPQKKSETDPEARIERAIIQSFEVFQSGKNGHFGQIYVKKFIHFFFFRIYNEKRDPIAFLGLVEKFDQEWIAFYLEEIFKGVLGSKVNTNQPWDLFFEAISEEVEKMVKAQG